MALCSPFVERVLPRAFNTRIRSDLNANATNVPLKEVSSHFYSLGNKMVPFYPEQRISDLLYTVNSQSNQFFELSLDLYGEITITYKTITMY